MAHVAGMATGRSNRSNRPGGSQGGARPSGARRRVKMLGVGLLVTLGASVVVTDQYFGSVGAAQFPPNVVEPPLAPTSIGVFSERDFVSIEGLDDTTSVAVQVWRGNNLIGQVDGLSPVGGIVEVNHPGGACWSTVTPDITAGDKVVVVSTDRATGAQLKAEATTTADVRITAAAHAEGDVVVVRGTATAANGSALPIDQLEVRIISTSANSFDVNGRRDLRAIDAGDDGTLAYDGVGTAWTATFPALSAADVARAVGAESAILWLGQDPAAGVESTHFESPGAPGPWSPTCNAPLQGSAVSTDITSIDFPSTPIGSSAPVRSIVLTNSGHDLEGLEADLVIGSIDIAGDAGFELVPGGGTCNAGDRIPITGTCRIDVTFSPTVAALAQASVRITTNAAGGVVTVPLAGLGRDADVGSLRALPTQADFGTITPGVPSQVQSIRVRNDGNVAVQVDGLVVDPVGATAGFSVHPDSTCLTAPVAGGAECTFDVVMVPTTTGPLSGTVTVTSDIAPDVVVALAGAGLVNGTAVPLDGSGIELGVFYARDFVSVGGFVPDESLTMQIIRNGVVVGYAHQVIAGADGIAEVNHPGGSCWERVTPDIRPFDILRVTRPDGRYYETTTADVGLDGHATYVQELDGTYTVEVHGWARAADGTPLPLSQLESRLVASSADPFDLSGRRTVRTPDDGTLTRDVIDNPDGSRVTARWTGMTLHDAQLAADPNTDSRLMWLGLDPVALNQITFFEHGADVANGPFDPSCGTAEPTSAGFAAAPSPVSFSNVYADGPGGVTTTRNVTIRNTGTAPLTISRLAFQGASSDEFAVVGATPASIAPGGRGTLTLQFDPADAGPADATLVITDTALGSPHRIALSGVGTDDPVASIVVAPGSLDFPDTQVGATSPTQSVTVSNEGSAPLDLTSISFQGADADAFGFGPASTCSVAADVQPGSDCTLAVKITPAHVNDSAATLVIESNAANAASVSVAVRGTSSTAANGTYDPPRAPATVEVFPVRDYVFGQGYGAGEFVDVEVIRNGQVIVTEQNIVPLDDPNTGGFDGIVEINHGAALVDGGPVVCWTALTPDIVTGDIVRMTVKNAAGATLASHQTHTQGVEVSMPATQVAPGTVQIAGYASDIFSSGALGNLEVRIVGASNNSFDANGRRTLRTGAEGSISWIVRDGAGVGTLSTTPAGNEWIATFSGLSSADVSRAVSGQSVVLWLGRDALAGTELTHAEWGEVVGPAGPECTAPAERPEPTVSATDLMVGYAGVGTPTAARAITFTNPGPGAITVSGVGLTSLSGPDAVDFDVTGSTCPATLDAGSSCTVSVRFDPTSATVGGRYASVAIRHSGANAVSFVPVHGVVVGPPTVTSVSPAPPNRVARGQVFRVTGTNLQATTAITVAGVDQPNFTVLSDTEIDVRVAQATPNSATAATLVVTTPGGTVTKPSAVRIQPLAPTVVSISPTSVPQGGTVTMTGTNLVNVTSVVFSGNAAATVFTPDAAGTSMTVTVPANAISGPVQVTTAGGTTASPSVTVTAVPSITGFGSATIRTGRTLTITGANLRSAGGATTVTFSGAAAVNATVNAAGTSLTVNVPAAANQGTVVVNVAGQTASSPTELVVERAPAAVTFPTTSVLRGSTVVLSGRNFLTTTSVQIGRVSATFTVVNATQISVTVPATALSGTVTVENRWGRATSAATLAVVQPPTVTGLSATTVSNNTGTATLQINGTNLNPAIGTVTVTIGTTPVVISALTATRITVIVPTTIAEGIYTVRVTTAAGTAAAATGVTVT